MTTSSNSHSTPTPTSSPTKIRPFAFVVCILAAMFYMYEFSLQVSTSVITNELMHDLGLNALTLGTLASFYYYAYTPMQLPAGLLYDLWGPRRLLTLAILVCAAGAFLFGSAHHAGTAAFGRFLMGAGSAFSFIGSLILIARWFPMRYFAFIVGIVELMSTIGGIAGQGPLAIAVHHWGWRHTILMFANIGVLLAFLVWLIVRDCPEKLVRTKKTIVLPRKNLLVGLKTIGKNQQTWWIALYSFLVWAPVTAFTMLWGVSFIHIAYGFSTTQAANACISIWIGIGLGCPFLGWWSDKMGLRCLPLSYVAFAGVIGLIVTLYVPHLPYTVLCLSLFLVGLAAAGQSLAFGVVKDNNRSLVLGTAIGINNMATVAGGALFQPFIGWLLNLNWTGVYQHNLPFYNILDYRKAFLVLPICYLLAFITSKFFIKETYCRAQYTEN